VKRAALFACLLGVTACSSNTVTESSTTVPEDSAITMAFVGDILPHSPLVNQAQRNAAAAGNVDGYDFSPMFADIAPLIASADLAICHLETPIAPQGEALSTFPFFGVPPTITEAIAKAGFDRCSTASNHTYDRGLAGIDTTINALLANNVAQSGMARTPNEIEPQTFSVKGVTLSHLSYTFSYNGLSLPQDQEWRSALIDTDRILRDARKAREMGADAVIVSMHWGNEMSHQLNSQQTNVADALTKSGDVDLIVGHHAHVVQPIEKVNGVWVMYGMGNVLSNLPTDERWPASSQDAGVFTITMRRNTAGKVLFDSPIVHPTWVDKQNGWIIRDITKLRANSNTSGVNTRELELSLGRTTRVLGEFITP
jgi:poly-gamma-glutamate synthesis protein (capsule biosynthesis protein)